MARSGSGGVPQHLFAFEGLRFLMQLHPTGDQVITPQMLSDGAWEPLESKIFVDIARHCSLVLDVGANIGWYTILASMAAGERGRVFAFEPHPGIRRILEHNVASNHLGNVSIVPFAIADTPARALFVFSDVNAGDHRLRGNESGPTGIEVEVTTLDTLQKSVFGQSPGLIKIDTQGAELAACLGMTCILEREQRPIVMVEFWPRGLTRYGSKPEAFVRFWQTRGYDAFLIDKRTGGLRTISFGAMRYRTGTDWHSRYGRFVDLVLVPTGDPRLEVIAPHLLQLRQWRLLWLDWLRPLLAVARREITRTW